MLLPIVIDATTIDDGSSEAARLEREDLLDRLIEYGITYFREGEMKKTLVRLQSLPTSEKKRWHEGLKSSHPRTLNAAGILPSDLEPFFDQDDALVVLATASADLTMEQIGLEPPVAVAPSTKTEYAAASHVRKSSSIKRREEWAVEDLRSGTNSDLELIASQRLAPLFESCRRLSIVDRYAFPTFCSDGKASGLSWLLGQLADNSQRPCKVSLYSIHSAKDEGRGLSGDLDIWVDAIKERCTGLNGELNLYLGLDRYYKEFAHDRYLRIDDSRVIAIGKGCAAFAGGSVSQRCGFKYQVLKRSDQHTAFRELEGQLERQTGVRVVTTALGSGFE